VFTPGHGIDRCEQTSPENWIATIESACDGRDDDRRLLAAHQQR